VKMLKKERFLFADDTRLRYEIDILKNLDHPNIMKLYEVYEDRSHLYLVTELCSGKELFDEILTRGKLSETDAADVMRHLLSAIAYCHRKNVCHRDLKPENILIDTRDPAQHNKVKLIDFGTGQVFTANQKMKQL
jgi:calcium-dependent protein kinase